MVKGKELGERQMEMPAQVRAETQRLKSPDRQGFPGLQGHLLEGTVRQPHVRRPIWRHTVPFNNCSLIFFFLGAGSFAIKFPKPPPRDLSVRIAFWVHVPVYDVLQSSGTPPLRFRSMGSHLF